jgi:hypothetical protein
VYLDSSFQQGSYSKRPPKSSLDPNLIIHIRSSISVSLLKAGLKMLYTSENCFASAETRIPLTPNQWRLNINYLINMDVPREAIGSENEERRVKPSPSIYCEVTAGKLNC